MWGKNILSKFSKLNFFLDAASGFKKKKKKSEMLDD